MKSRVLAVCLILVGVLVILALWLRPWSKSIAAIQPPPAAGKGILTAVQTRECQVLIQPGEMIFDRPDGSRKHVVAREDSDQIKLDIRFDEAPTTPAAASAPGLQFKGVTYTVNLEKNRPWFALLDHDGQLFFGYLNDEAIYEKAGPEGSAQSRLADPQPVFDAVRKYSSLR